MPDGFVSLREYVRHDEPERVVSMPEVLESNACEPDVEEDDERDAAFAAFISQVKRMRAALADACTALSEDLTRDISIGILARELRLAPIDIAAIVEATLDRARNDLPVAVHVHPDDLTALGALDVRTIPDPALRRGDVTIDVRHGSIDASLGVRLDALLEAYRSV
ncbi:MAG: FliH/SctL family protein [Vulcanimicrobiaceae bacterium]